MMKKILIMTFLIWQVWNIGFAQTSVDKKLIGVWKLNYENSNVCLVFTNQSSGSVTDKSGSVYYFFAYQITSDNGTTFFNKHIPIYHDEKENDKYLIQLKNDTTLLLNKGFKEKNAQLMLGKYVSTYTKLSDVNAEDFIRKRSQKDLIGTWLNVFKKDTLMALTFKSNNVLELKDKHTGQLVSGKYNINTDKQPMELDIVNSVTGELNQSIFVFDAPNRIRTAGPKNGKRRTHFTVFGNNGYLIKEK